MGPNFEHNEDTHSSERVMPRGGRELSNRQTTDDLPQRAENLLSGMVIAYRGLFTEVQLDSGEIRRCVLRGKLETVDSIDSTFLVVGDRVEITPVENTDANVNEGVIENRLPRENVIVRGDKRNARFRRLIAANINRVLLVSSITSPKFRPGLVDRFLVAVSTQGLAASLVINKIDLINNNKKLTEELEQHRELYASLGVDIIMTSAIDGTGIDEIKNILSLGGGVLVGHSGVGKSSLINSLDDTLNLNANPVNKKTGKGTHTTSIARFIPLKNGLKVIDTPGVRELAIVDVSPDDLEAHFPEFLPLLPECRMDNCQHKNEPDCAIKNALSEGGISPRRYKSYIDIRTELEERELQNT